MARSRPSPTKQRVPEGTLCDFPAANSFAGHQNFRIGYNAPVSAKGRFPPANHRLRPNDGDDMFALGSLLLSLCIGGARTADAPRGAFVFFSNRVFALEGKARTAERTYLRRFRVCLTNGYENFAGTEREALRAAGCELFIYLWFNGYYEKELARTDGEGEYVRRFPDMLEAFRAIHAHPEWLLNPSRPMQGAGAAAPAYFYDYGNPDFRAHY